MDGIGLVLQMVGALLSLLTCHPTSVTDPGSVAGAVACHALRGEREDATAAAIDASGDQASVGQRETTARTDRFDADRH